MSHWLLGLWIEGTHLRIFFVAPKIFSLFEKIDILGKTLVAQENGHPPRK